MTELTFLEELMSSESKQCDICRYSYFLNKGFNLQLNVCNRCHDLFMMYSKLSDIAILNIKSADYCCIISGISLLLAE